MDQALEDYGNGKKRKRELPLHGLYSCLFCERHFGRKIDLKRHYRENHQESIPDFGEKIDVFYQ